MGVPADPRPTAGATVIAWPMWRPCCKLLQTVITPFGVLAQPPRKVAPAAVELVSESPGVRRTGARIESADPAANRRVASGAILMDFNTTALHAPRFEDLSRVASVSSRPVAAP